MSEEIIKYLPYIYAILFLIIFYLFVMFIIHAVKLHSFKGNTPENIFKFRDKNEFSWKYVNLLTENDTSKIVVHVKWYYLPNHYARKSQKILAKHSDSYESFYRKGRYRKIYSDKFKGNMLHTTYTYYYS